MRIIDIKFNDYDWQMILDFVFLLPTHSYIYETIWLLESLTQWLFELPKTENVVKTERRKRNESMVIMEGVANEYSKHLTHWYNIHFILDCDDECRKIYETALKESYETYNKIKSSLKRHNFNVYCILSREPHFSLYYATEKTVPKKYNIK